MMRKLQIALLLILIIFFVYILMLPKKLVLESAVPTYPNPEVNEEQQKPVVGSVIAKPPFSAYQRWLEIEDKTQWPDERFYKVDFNGNVLPEGSSVWACVYDSFTGLMWEVKDNTGGWQDQEHTYSWYQPPTDIDLLQLESLEPQFGLPDKGSCFDIACDTHSYQQYANESWLCSSNDWRLPQAHEMGLLDHDRNYNPDINTNYFPHTMSGYYWSQTQPPEQKTLVWAVDFKNGFPYIKEKRIPSFIRLVTEAPPMGSVDRR